MSEKNIEWLKDLSKDSIAVAGGKGANLAEMYNAKFPVPPAFIITAQAYKKFVTETKIQNKILSKLKDLNIEDTDLLQKTAKEIQDIILGAKVPEEIKEDIIDAYDLLCIEGKSKVDMNEILKPEEEVFTAVRSSATAEDLPSIDENSHVFIKVDGKPVYDTIKKIYDKFGDGSNLNIEVASMKDNKVKWTKAKQIYKHSAKDKTLFKITTETGREITITKKHSLIILDKDTLKPKTANIEDLEGNEMVPVTRRITALNLNYRYLDVKDYLNSNEIVYENNLVYVKNKSNNWRIQNPLARKIKIDEEFAYFLGLYCAEGSTYKNNCIIITNSNKKIMKRAIRFLTKLSLYNKQKINKNSIRVYCKSFVLLLHQLTGIPLSTKVKGKSCKIKQVPDFIFGCNKKIIGSFLAGCFDGDGYVSKNAIEYCSTSKKLTGGIVKLLEIIGIDFYIRKKGDAFVIVIPPSQSKKFGKEVQLENTSKTNKLNALIKRYNLQKKYPEFLNSVLISNKLSANIKSDFDRRLNKEDIEVSICPLCKNTLEKSSYYKNKLRYYCKNCRKAFYENQVKKEIIKKYVNYDNKGNFIKNAVPWNKGIIKKKRLSKNKFNQLMKRYGLNNHSEFLNSDILWDRVKKIEKINYTGYVYDFTVPGIENFAAGIGGIITHNTASFAGQQATFLNIKGKDNLMNAVRGCWASLFTARAIYYRTKNNFPHDKVLIAVVIQKMVNSDKSGVMFSINPATNNPDEIVIEGAFGLGEAVVSGAVNPDLYIVDKNTKKIIKTEIKEQKIKYVKDPETGKTIHKPLTPSEEKLQVLNEKEILELARQAKKIEEHYGKPQDMEWAIEKNKVYIVQARAVTTFKKKNEEKAEEKKELGEVLVKGETASAGVASGPVKIILEMKDLDKIEKGDIMVTTMTTPDMVPAMQKAAAIVTDEGGLTCHAAIVSREMKIPCIVGTGDATKKLKEGEEVTVYATYGNVYAGKKEVKEAAAPEVQAAAVPIITATKVKVIMDLPDFAEKAAATGADGVGLVRLEIMIANGGIHPAEYIRQGKVNDYIKLLEEGIGKIAAAFKGKQVWVRTSDMRTDEYRNLDGGDKEPKESDPMLGWHAIRRQLDEPEILKAEFTAIKNLHEKGLKNIGVMIPFVIRTRELREAKKIMREVGLEPVEDIDFGVMIETPASCWIIDDLCKEGISFVSFGTNDLTQLTLGIDRNNERIAKLFDEMHHAVLGELSMVIKACKKAGVETSICGQAGSKPEMAKFLVKEGIDSISANPDAVQSIRKIVARTERELMLEADREELKK